MKEQTDECIHSERPRQTDMQTYKWSGACHRHAKATHAIAQLARVGLSSREHLLQVVNALPHNLDVLQAILGSLCTPECKDSCAAFQPTHMHLQHILDCQHLIQATECERRRVFMYLVSCSGLKCKMELNADRLLKCLVMHKQEKISWKSP